MSDSQVTLRTRKFIRNPLLGRKQMVVCVQPLHDAAIFASAATDEHTERTKLADKRRNNMG